MNKLLPFRIRPLIFQTKPNMSSRLLLLLAVCSMSMSRADTPFSEAAGNAHLDHTLEAPFIASSTILIEAKTLSHFASQKHAEMSDHLSNKRETLASTPLLSWREALTRYGEQVSLHTKVVKQAASVILERVQENVQAAYHVLQILEAIDKISVSLSRVQELSDMHLQSTPLSSAQSQASGGEDGEQASGGDTLECRRMHSHWRQVRKEADNVVHEAKHIKKSLIILKQSGATAPLATGAQQEL